MLAVRKAGSSKCWQFEMLEVRNAGSAKALAVQKRWQCKKAPGRTHGSQGSTKGSVSMTLRFGTDGVRGLANAELTPEFTLALGRAAARVLTDGSGIAGSASTTQRPTMLIGRDTRQSGQLLFGALSAGLMAEGCDVVDLGVLPTPGVAKASEATGHPAAMISASHNPFADNGIKFFSAGGRKLPDDIEARIEAELDKILMGPPSPGSALTGVAVGVQRDDDHPDDHYAESLATVLEGRNLSGLTVVLDCANGAASHVAPAVFRSLGATVHVIFNDPDGVNINAGCGSTHPEVLQRTVLEHQANIGFAFDGDADRMLAVDHQGVLVDGDQLMAMVALDLRERGQLHQDTVVVTVMSNLGFKLAMQDAGITVVETKVGDRYVLEALEEGSFSLGGEQSGHIIVRDRASTGDGTLAALMVADLVQRSQKSLADHSRVMNRLPQLLKNVKGVDRSRLDSNETLWAEVRAAEKRLGRTGRVLLRPSGTEPLVRVMVEAPTLDEATQVCEHLCSVVEQELALS
jgi:phosphoglucosamine mutase